MTLGTWAGVEPAGRPSGGKPAPVVRPGSAAGNTVGGHVPELDGVRGLAIGLVLLFHLLPPLGPSANAVAVKLLARGGGSGWVGVDLFFALSGFLITGILYDAKGARNFFRSFYARRALRIFPLYYGLLFAVFVARLAPLAPGSEQAWFWLYGVNVLRVVKGPGACGALEHLWSLAVEEHFYLVWPLAVFLLRRRALMWVSALTLPAALAVRAAFVARGDAFAAYMLTPCRVDAMAAGAFLALAVRGPGGPSAVTPWARRALAASGLALAALVASGHGLLFHLGPLAQTIGYTVLAVFFGSCLAAAVAPGTAGGLYRRALRTPPLRFLGTYSYGVYVYHLPLAVLVAARWPALAVSAPAAGVAGALARFGMMSAASLAVAWVSWHVYEKPFLTLKRYFVPR